MMRRLKNILTGKRIAILLGALMIFAAMPSAVLAEEPDTDVEVDSETVSPDVQSYAEEWGLTYVEATRRMELQDIIGELNAALKENESDTFAGLWIEHGTANDDFGAVALFTQNGEQTIRRYSLRDDSVQVGGPERCNIYAY